MRLDTAQRRSGTNAVREHDYVTMAQCVKIAVGVAEKLIAQAQEQREQDARASVWYRRLWRRIARRVA